MKIYWKNKFFVCKKSKKKTFTIFEKSLWLKKNYKFKQN